MTHWDVRPADPDRWADVIAVMGTRGDPSRCWCQFFHRRGRDWASATPASNRDRLCAQIRDEPVAPGVLAYDADQPIGWCQVAPKRRFARLLHSPTSRAPADAPDPEGLWAVTCFVVPARHRRQGVASRLLDGAVEHARTHGASGVEGYPVDVTARTSVSSAELYHGTLSLFRAAGSPRSADQRLPGWSSGAIWPSRRRTRVALGPNDPAAARRPA